MIERVTLKSQAYNYLKERITKGDLKAGELYTEQGMAQVLNISRTPVREAVLQLAHEDFVYIKPNKGFIVKEYTQKEIEDYFQVRMAVEGFCGMYSVKLKDTKIWNELVKELEKYILEEREMLSGPADVEEFMANDLKFHMAIVSFSQNKQMMKIMEDMRGRIDRVGKASLGIEGRMYNSYCEHRNIFEAIKSGSKDGIYNAIDLHFKSCVEIMK